MNKIEVCPGTLAVGYSKYSPGCIKKLFDGIQVSPILDFNYNPEEEAFIDSAKRISISGVQEKLSVIVQNKKILLTPKDESGRYIIKPIPGYQYLKARNQMPANEHLTMQIASQVYKIKTSENAMIFFANGEPAYITKRFDYTPDGLKIPQEDFSSLAGKSKATHGEDFKYSGSYEDIAALIRKYVPAWKIEISKYFSLVVFNYLFGNGDAHLKNFSVQQTPGGDYILTPAYDLLNTSIHVNDGDFALQEGLLPKECHSIIYRSSGHPCRDDFAEFGQRIGVLPKKMESIIETFATEQHEVYNLIERSFLDERTKRIYKRSYQERLHRFQRSNK